MGKMKLKSVYFQTGVSYRPLTRDCPMVDAVLGKTVDVKVIPSLSNISDVFRYIFGNISIIIFFSNNSLDSYFYRKLKVDRMGEEHWNCIQDILVHWRLTDKGPDKSLMGINFSKILSSEGLPIIDLSLVAIVSIIGTCITLSLIRGNDSLTFSQNTVAYNSSQYFRVRRLADGSQEFDLLVVTDLDHDSKDTEKKNTWQSIVKKGILRLNSGKNSAQIEWKDNEEFSLTTIETNMFFSVYFCMHF
uniref:Transmembrane protein n=1 Tax=Heterorhabditis bacteriophora TaxID=37862 RepID=A0A1I7XFY2_HETBA